jgi:hypothetical protein
VHPAVEQEGIMMQTGEKFLISTEMLGIERMQGRSRTITVPSGAVVEVVNLHCEDDGRLADVLWEERSVMLFGKDLIHLAEKIEPALIAAC